MKKIIATVLVAAIFFLACNEKKAEEGADKKNPETVKAIDKKTTAPVPMPDSATMEKNWKEYMTPGDMHKMLAKMDGNWTGEATFWMQPGAPPQKATVAATNKMIMNGLYQQTTNSGNMMGMPFQGMGINGYDNHLKLFISTWVDNMGSGISTLKGPWDAASKTITLRGKMVDPFSKGETEVKQTIKITDDTHEEMEMFTILPDGKEFKTMNIVSTKKA
jgi:hypothetical protein